MSSWRSSALCGLTVDPRLRPAGYHGRMIDAYDTNDPDPEKRELASVQLVDELFGPGLLDRMAKQEGREAWLREVRERSDRTVA